MILATFMDSYPVFPSSYRPVFLWFLLLIFPVAVINKIKIQFEMNYIIISYIIMLVVSFIYSQTVYKNLKGFLDYLTTIILFIVAYISYIFILKQISYKNLKNSILKIGNFLICIGFLEQFSYYGILPKSIKLLLNIIFTGGGESRFKLISSEASWATMTLLFFFVFFFYYKLYFQSTLIFFLIVGTVSFQGICSVIIYLIFYFFRKDKKKFIVMFFLMGLFIVLLYICIKKILLITGNQNLYFARRLFILDNLKLDKIIYIDGSIFIRIIQPFIGIKIWLSNIFTFLIGIGGGNYRFEYENQMLLNYPIYYKKNHEIVNNIKFLTGTPKNLYSRIISEGGIISIILFGIGYIKLYFKANKLNKEYLILLSILYLQFDSYIYLVFALVLAMCNVYKKNKQ